MPLAVDRARVLVGCYRLEDASDPAVYARAVSDVLSRYPDEVILAVSDPGTGVPARLKWLPSIKEIVDACDDAMEPILRARADEERRQRKALPEPAPKPKLSIDEIEAKLGRPLPRLRRMDGSVRTKSVEEAEAIAAARRSPPHDDPPEAA